MVVNPNVLFKDVDLLGESTFDQEDAVAYKNLKKALTDDFSTLRIYKVGEPDSGALDLYLIGRDKDGHLIGLKTVSVET